MRKEKTFSDYILLIIIFIIELYKLAIVTYLAISVRIHVGYINIPIEFKIIIKNYIERKWSN